MINLIYDVQNITLVYEISETSEKSLLERPQKHLN